MITASADITASPPQVTLKAEQWQDLETFLKILTPETQSKNSAANAYYHQGVLLVAHKDFAGARASFYNCVNADAEFAPAHAAMGMLLFFENENNGGAFDSLLSAVHWLNTAVTLRPNFPEIHFFLGNVCSKIDHPDSALFWRRAAEQDSQNKDLQIVLANHSMWNEKNVERALQHFENAITIDPDFLEAYNKTNFYKLYLNGPLSPEVSAHTASIAVRTAERAAAHQVDKLPLRRLNGIAPFIGHYAYLDTFIKLRELGWMKDVGLVMFAKSDQIANRALLSYCDRYIPTISDSLVLESFSAIENFMDFDCGDIRGFRDLYHGDSWRLAAAVQEEWEKQKRAPVLQLSDLDKQRGSECLSKLGVPKGAWFVSLHVRDDGFKGPDNTQALRNADINSYLPALKEITDRGGWVIRMGDKKMTPLPQTAGVIDYARSEQKSEWMDLFLWSQCRFFIGGNSGPSWIPHMFGVPRALVNWAPITRVPWTSADILIPKWFLRKEDARPLTFREIIDPAGAVSWTHSDTGIQERGLFHVDNTPGQLSDVVKEMIERCDSTARYDSEDEELQRRLAQIVRDVSQGYTQSDRTSRFGRQFLRDHKDLLW